MADTQKLAERLERTKAMDALRGVFASPTQHDNLENWLNALPPKTRECVKDYTGIDTKPLSKDDILKKHQIDDRTFIKGMQSALNKLRDQSELKEAIEQYWNAPKASKIRLNLGIKKPKQKRKKKNQSAALRLKLTSNKLSNTNTAIEAFFSAVESSVILTREEEAKLGVAIQSGTPEEKEEAKDLLIHSNLKFALGYAKRYQGRGLELFDLIQAAHYGLITAAPKYNPYKRLEDKKNKKQDTAPANSDEIINEEPKTYRFTTFAAYHIQGEISSAFNENYKIAKLPDSLFRKLEEVRQLIDSAKYSEDRRQYPSISQLCENTSLTERSIRKILNYLMIEAVALDSDDPLDFYSIEEKTESTTFNKPDAHIDQEALEKNLLDAIAKLKKPMQRCIMIMRLGLCGYHQHTQKEIGYEFDTSASNIHAKEKIARKHLKRILEDQKLSPDHTGQSLHPL